MNCFIHFDLSKTKANNTDFWTGKPVNTPFHAKHKATGCNHCLKFRQFCKSGVCNQSLVSSLIHEKPHTASDWAGHMTSSANHCARIQSETCIVCKQSNKEGLTKPSGLSGLANNIPTQNWLRNLRL